MPESVFTPENNYEQFKQVEEKRRDIALQKGMLDGRSWIRKIFHKRERLEVYGSLSAQDDELSDQEKGIIIEASLHMPQIRIEAMVENIKRNPKLLETLKEDYSQLNEQEMDRFFQDKIPIIAAYVEGVLKGKNKTGSGLLPSEQAERFENSDSLFLTEDTVWPFSPCDFGIYSKMFMDREVGTNWLAAGLVSLTESTKSLLQKDQNAATTGEVLHRRYLLKLARSLENFRRYVINLSPCNLNSEFYDNEIGDIKLTKEEAGRFWVLGYGNTKNKNLGKLRYDEAMYGLQILYPLLLEELQEINNV